MNEVKVSIEQKSFVCDIFSSCNFANRGHKNFNEHPINDCILTTKLLDTDRFINKCFDFAPVDLVESIFDKVKRIPPTLT